MVRVSLTSGPPMIQSQERVFSDENAHGVVSSALRPAAEDLPRELKSSKSGIASKSDLCRSSALTDRTHLDDTINLTTAQVSDREEWSSSLPKMTDIEAEQEDGLLAVGCDSTMVHAARSMDRKSLTILSSIRSAAISRTLERPSGQQVNLPASAGTIPVSISRRCVIENGGISNTDQRGGLSSTSLSLAMNESLEDDPYGLSQHFTLLRLREEAAEEKAAAELQLLEKSCAQSGMKIQSSDSFLKSSEENIRSRLAAVKKEIAEVRASLLSGRFRQMDFVSKQSRVLYAEEQGVDARLSSEGIEKAEETIKLLLPHSSSPHVESQTSSTASNTIHSQNFVHARSSLEPVNPDAPRSGNQDSLCRIAADSSSESKRAKVPHYFKIHLRRKPVLIKGYVNRQTESASVTSKGFLPSASIGLQGSWFSEAKLPRKCLDDSKSTNSEPRPDIWDRESKNGKFIAQPSQLSTRNSMHAKTLNDT